MDRNRVRAQRNAEAYARTLGGSNAVRITVPMIHTDHVRFAAMEFRQLAEALEQIADAPPTNGLFGPAYRRLSAARQVIYEAHRNLLKHATGKDFPLDFRGAR